ncbi:MAG TPA: lipid-A-disaccharide synthase [Rhizobiales bacterium]|nr:lipid-A-disaccharide synthase [Hyphomicrobiales bacterium]
MTAGSAPLRIAVVAGEESGDLLAADLVAALSRMTGRAVELVGVGGRHLETLGLRSLFDPADIALMGVSAILQDLPRLVRRIGETARRVAAAKPDCLVTIDSPEFTLRVARKLRQIAPGIPIVHYVCPSVWAWRPGRAPAMKPHVDRILCVLPFEVEELRRLDGPPGIYVGHRLVTDPGIAKAASLQAARPAPSGGAEKTLLLLPGSRRGEVRRLIAPFAETVSIMRQRGHRLRLLLPTVPNVADLVRASVAGWELQPEVLITPEEKWDAFGSADAALIASGTVSLELALAGVPMASCYRFDAVARLATGLITVWSAALPNLIADRPLVPEFYDQFVRPKTIARYLEALVEDTPMRRWQTEGFTRIRRLMSTDRPSGEIAAGAVLDIVSRRT